MATISVSLSLMADLRKYWPKGTTTPQRYELPDGATIEDLLAKLDIHEDEITVAINGELSKRSSVLSNGDDVVLFSPMEGG